MEGQSSSQPFPIQDPLPLLPGELLRSPLSRRKGNSSLDKERHDRLTSCHFLRTLGTQLRLPYRVLATGCVCFHRVLLYHSERQWSMHEVVAACVLAASKIEEAPRRVEDIVQVYHPLLYPGLDSLEKDSDQFRQLRSRIISIEAVILSSIGYRFHIKHPHEYALSAVQRMWLSYADLPTLDRDPSHAEIVFRTSSPSLRSSAGAPYTQSRELAMKFGLSVWQLVEQSFNGHLCLEYPPQPIALAAILLASVLHQSQLPLPSQFVIPDCITVSETAVHQTAMKKVKEILPQLRWWQWFLPSLSPETLSDIAVRIWQSIHTESPLLRQLIPVIERHQRSIQQQSKMTRMAALQDLLEQRLKLPPGVPSPSPLQPKQQQQQGECPVSEFPQSVPSDSLKPEVMQVLEELVPSGAIPWYLWWFKWSDSPPPSSASGRERKSDQMEVDDFSIAEPKFHFNK